MSEDYEKFHEIAPFIVNIDPSIQLNDEDCPWLRRKGTHAKKKFHTQRSHSGMWPDLLSSLSSLVSFWTYISGKSHFGQTVGNLCNSWGAYVFWPLKHVLVCFRQMSSIFNPFQLHLVFFSSFTGFFELKDPEIEMHYKWTLKRLKVGMVTSFHPHSMC